MLGADQQNGTTFGLDSPPNRIYSVTAIAYAHLVPDTGPEVCTVNRWPAQEEVSGESKVWRYLLYDTHFTYFLDNIRRCLLKWYSKWHSVNGL